MFTCSQRGIQAFLRFPVDGARNEFRSHLWTLLILQRHLHGRIRSGKRDVAGEIRQRLDVGVTHQGDALHVLADRGTVAYRVHAVGILLGRLEDFFFTDFASGELGDIARRRAEEGTGVQHVEQRFRRLLPINIFQLGVGLNANDVAAAKLTRLRQDLNQVRQLVQGRQLVGEDPHAAVTVFTHRQQPANGDGQPHGDNRLEGSVGVSIGGDKQPAVLTVLTHAAHPVAYGE